MPLSGEDLSAYVGGELEIVNPGAGSIYRGSIRNLECTDGVVRVLLAWQARGEGLPPSGWVADGVRVSHVFDSEDYRVTRDIDGIRICPFGERRELVFRRNASRGLLRSSQVRGLDIAHTLDEELESSGWQFMAHCP